MLNYFKVEQPSVQKFKHYWALTFNRVEPLDHRQKRYQRIAQSVFAAFAGKGIAVIVNFISIPLTISYLGAERYGVWVTISTLLAWLQIADLGLGNGLTNAISEAYGKNRPELAQRHVATTFWMLSSVAALLGILLFSIWPLISWSAVFNTQSTLAKAEVATAVAAAIFFALITLPLTSVDKVLGGYQESAISHSWNAAANLLSLVGIIVVTQLQGGLFWLVVGYSGSVVTVKAVSALWLFGRHMPWLRPTWSAIKRSDITKITRTGGMFFTVQISSLLITQTDNLIIAHYLGATQVTPYNVAWRLFFYATMPQIMIFSALWPAYAEAFARNDGQWIRRSFGVNMVGSTLFTTILVIPLVLFGTSIIEKWAGPAAVPPYALLIWMGIWSIINTSMNVIACILNASGHLQGQMVYGLATAIVNIWLSIVWAESYGVTGVIAATVTAYIVCNVIPATLETRFIINRLGKS